MTRFDLHIHSALSACAEMIMSPRQVLLRARAAGLTLLALTDHNASAHVRLAQRIGQELGIQVIPGLEVASREEVHLLVYFTDNKALAEFQERVDRSLPAAVNSPEFFGYQLIYNDQDEVVDCDERLRQVGTGLGIEEIMAHTHRLDGAVVPAHVFRKRYSLMSQLGFIDAAAVFDAVEIARPEWVKGRYHLGQRVEGYPVLTGSDAHFLEDVGRLQMELERSVNGIHDLIRYVKDLAK